jgi:hypothetical protein
MMHRQQFIPDTVRSLLNNLDSVSGACGELLAVSGHDTHGLLRLELTVIAHVLQAREHMRELQAADNALASQIALFLAVTDCLEASEPPKGQAAPAEGAANRLIAGRIPAATLIALAAAMRDVLELCRVVFDHEAVLLHRPVPISEAQVWATGPEAG